MIYAIFVLQIGYRALVVYKGKRNIILFCTVAGSSCQCRSCRTQDHVHATTQGQCARC